MDILKKIDWQLNIAIFIIMSLGLITLSSGFLELFYQQLVWMILGIFILLFIPFLNLRHFFSYRWIILLIFFFSIVLLILVQIFGVTVSGSRSWLGIGSFGFQPSELAKLTLILVLASFFSRRHVGIKKIETILGSFFYLIFPIFLILLEPDVGAALIFFGIWFGFLLGSGMPLKYLLLAFPFILVLSLLIWNFGFEDYQRARILGFLSPWEDPLGVNYNVIQSKIAIGSAGLFGKGFGQGTQVNLGFLPVAHTDFIFAAFVEEWGILAGIILIFIFSYIIFRICKIAIRSHNNFNKLFCLGAVLFFFFQFIINIGSTLGLTPVIGVVFPFLSYGGSNFLTSSLIIGIIQNIAVSKEIS